MNIGVILGGPDSILNSMGVTLNAMGTNLTHLFGYKDNIFQNGHPRTSIHRGVGVFQYLVGNMVYNFTVLVGHSGTHHGRGRGGHGRRTRRSGRCFFLFARFLFNDIVFARYLRRLPFLGLPR